MFKKTITSVFLLVAGFVLETQAGSCSVDEAQNQWGPNQCESNGECCGERWCSENGWCQGDSGCNSATQPELETSYPDDKNGQEDGQEDDQEDSQDFHNMRHGDY